MKPPPFEYVAPETVEEAVALLAEHDGEAKVLAGGQSLMPMLNFRLLEPAILVDIGRIPGLGGIAEKGDRVSIGALTRHRDVENSPLVRDRFPVVTHAMSHVAHLAIRNRGTLGGSLSHADPAAELPMMAVLLDAELNVAGSDGARTVDAREFFVGTLTTDLAEDEIVTGVDFPVLPAGTGWGFEEVSRRSGDFALAAAAATLTVTGGTVSQVRLAVMGVDDTPLRIDAAEALLAGHALDGDTLDAVRDAVRETVNPNSDVQASADYRRHLIGVLAGRALEAAWARAAGGVQ